MRRLLLMIFISLTFLLSNSNITMAYEREIKSLSVAMAENIANAGKKMIAVVDFTDLQGNVTELGRFLAEEFSIALAGAGKGFEVVDRTHLKSIIAEHKLSSTGIIDPQTARKLGQIAGVEAIITGTITPFGDSVRLSVKVLATDTAKIIAASSGDIAKTKAIEELLLRGIETGQTPSPQASPTSYVSSSGSSISKKIGDMVVTMKKIMVSRGQVTVILDLYNQSGEKLKVARDSNAPSPNLVDEKGNIFEYRDGLESVYYASLSGEGYGVTLNPRLNNDVRLNFSYNERNISLKDLGSDFTFSLNLLLYDPKDKLVTKHQVSFTDIKAQRPK